MCSFEHAYLVCSSTNLHSSLQLVVRHILDLKIRRCTGSFDSLLDSSDLEFESDEFDELISKSKL